MGSCPVGGAVTLARGMRLMPVTGTHTLVFSCGGTSSHQGNDPDARVLQALIAAEAGGHAAHTLTPADFFSFAGTITFAILVSAVIALFIYEHYAAKKK
jgi:hypothetical protein